MSWKVPKLYPNSTIYVIGSGPSLIGMDLCLPPRNGKYGLDAYLHDKHIVGVNAGATVIKNTDVLWFGDAKHYWQNQKEVDNFKGLKITCNKGLKWGWQSLDGVPNLNIISIIKTRGLSLDPSGIGWNRSSGASGINIAYHLGAKRIVLLGFDMDDNEHKKYRPALRLEHKSGAYAHMKGMLNNLADDAKAHGIEILNANKDSAITQFKKVDLREVT